jgi:hypothetical protein
LSIEVTRYASALEHAADIQVNATGELGFNVRSLAVP